jgi:hypothetical protein
VIRDEADARVEDEVRAGVEPIDEVGLEEQIDAKIEDAIVGLSEICYRAFFANVFERIVEEIVETHDVVVNLVTGFVLAIDVEEFGVKGGRVCGDEDGDGSHCIFLRNVF